MATPFSSQPVLTYPITALATEIIISALVLAFTARSSIMRLALFPVIRGISWFLVHTAVRRLRTPRGTLAGGVSFVFLLKPRSFETEPSDWTVWNEKTQEDDDKLNGHINAHGHGNGHITGDSRKTPSGQGADEDTPWNRLCFGISTLVPFAGFGAFAKPKLPSLLEHRHKLYALESQVPPPGIWNQPVRLPLPRLR
jgi:hypothetical protein